MTKKVMASRDNFNSNEECHLNYHDYLKKNQKLLSRRIELSTMTTFLILSRAGLVIKFVMTFQMVIFDDFGDSSKDHT